MLLAFLSIYLYIYIYIFPLATLALCYPLPERITDENDRMTIKKHNSYWNLFFCFCSPIAVRKALGPKGCPLMALFESLDPTSKAPQKLSCIFGVPDLALGSSLSFRASFWITISGTWCKTSTPTPALAASARGPVASNSFQWFPVVSSVFLIFLNVVICASL